MCQSRKGLLLLHDVYAWNGGIAAWMLIDGEDDKKISSSQNEALPFAHLALCRGAIPSGVSLTAVADLEFDVALRQQRRR